MKNKLIQLSNQEENDEIIKQKINNTFGTLLKFSTIDTRQLEDISTLRSNGTFTNQINMETSEESLKREHHLINAIDFHTSTWKDKDGTIKSVRIRKKGKCVICGKCSG